MKTIPCPDQKDIKHCQLAKEAKKLNKNQHQKSISTPKVINNFFYLLKINLLMNPLSSQLPAIKNKIDRVINALAKKSINRVL